MGPFKPGAQGDCPACYYYRAGPVCDWLMGHTGMPVHRVGWMERRTAS